MLTGDKCGHWQVGVELVQKEHRSNEWKDCSPTWCLGTKNKMRETGSTTVKQKTINKPYFSCD